MFLFQIYKDKPSILCKGKTRKFRWIPENYQIKDLKKFEKYNGIYLDTAENECAIEIWRKKDWFIFCDQTLENFNNP